MDRYMIHDNLFAGSQVGHPLPADRYARMAAVASSLSPLALQGGGNELLKPILRVACALAACLSAPAVAQEPPRGLGHFDFGEIWQGRGFSHDLLSGAFYVPAAAPAP